MSAATHEKLSAVLIVALLIGSVVAVGGVVFAQTTAGNDGEQTVGNVSQETSYLRVAHASPDAPAVDVQIANQTVLSNVSFGNVSDYLAIEDGIYTVNVTAADDPNATVFNGTISVQARTVTTLAATGEVTESGTVPFEVASYADDAWMPAPNQSALRIVHLSPDAPGVDVTTANGSVVLADNVSYQDASDYTSVPAGNYTVSIREATATNNGSVVAQVDASLENETAYSAMAIGYLNPDDAAAETPFEVNLVEDAALSVHLPSEAPPNETETPTPTETETPTETPTPTETETPNETETAMPNETETAMPNETVTETPNGTVTETPNETETEEPTVTEATPEGEATETALPTEFEG